MRMMHEEFLQVAYERRPELRAENDLSHRQFIFLAMKQYFDLYVQDLWIIIIVNCTKCDFITSDDPCFFTNRFFIRKIKKDRSANFGLAPAGALFFLPLTPRHLLMCYDGQVYTVPDREGHYVVTDRSADIKALNELQFLKASENLYFSDWHARESVRTNCHEISKHRANSWHQIDVLVPAETAENGERYRRASIEERMTATKTLQIMSSRYPEPLHWISRLRYRTSPKFHYDGSAIGYVRKQEWLKGEA